MNKRTILSIKSVFLKASLLLLVSSQAFSNIAMAGDSLTKFAKGKHRSESNVARNEFRHPVETLKFFGIEPSMTVVEISPGGGWYAEILAPYLKEHGTYIAAGYDPKSKSEYFSSNAKKFADKLAADPKHYSKAKLSVMQAPGQLDFATKNSVDMVVSFRNTHNWASRGHAEAVYAAIYKSLKPNGVFGLVQHRAGDKNPADTSGKKGYLKTADIISMATKAGFVLQAQSEINANPKDTKDYEAGVWSLPPVYRLKDKDRAKMTAIGESDRMTLKFVKPVSK